MSRSSTPVRTERANGAESEAYAAAVGRYVSGESDLADAADRAGLSRWEFVERLRESGVESPAPSSELV